MQKACERIAVIVLMMVAAVVGASAQAAQPPISNEPVPGQQGNAAQAQSSQMSSETLTPEAQAKLIKGITHALIMLPYYGVYDNLAFRLQGRTVILEGQVARSSLRPDAERAVKKVEGVEKVVNNIEVLPPGPMDDRLRRAVYDAIYKYGPLFKYANQPNPPIRIIVKGSRVSLEGVVDNETDKGLCTMRANQVEGVLSVTNNLRVVKSQ